MIVANYDNVVYVYVSERGDPMVTLHFVDGSELPLFNSDALKVKSDLRLFTNATDSWSKVSYG